MTVSKKWWDQLSKDEQKVVRQGQPATERQDTREKRPRLSPT